MQKITVVLIVALSLIGSASATIYVDQSAPQFGVIFGVIHNTLINTDVTIDGQHVNVGADGKFEAQVSLGDHIVKLADGMSAREEVRTVTVNTNSKTANVVFEGHAATPYVAQSTKVEPTGKIVIKQAVLINKVTGAQYDFAAALQADAEIGVKYKIYVPAADAVQVQRDSNGHAIARIDVGTHTAKEISVKVIWTTDGVQHMIYNNAGSNLGRFTII